MERSLGYWLPVLIWAVLITSFSTGTFHGGLTYRLVRDVLFFFSSDISPQTIELVHLGVRKLAHVGEFFMLTLLLYRAFRRGAPLDGHWRWALASCLLAVGFAALDEIHQAFEVRRSGTFGDVGIDALGALMAQGFLYGRYRQARTQPISSLP
jgi:VanZ family protein